jgi:hypothetical protein
LRELWPDRHHGLPIEHKGTAIVDGNGGEAYDMAVNLSELGFTVALYRDSDVALTEPLAGGLRAAGIPVFEYGDDFYTELAIFSAADTDQVQKILEFSREELGEAFINDNVAAKIVELDSATVTSAFGLWKFITDVAEDQIKVELAEIACVV